MATLEDKSVRGMVKDIDERTKSLEPVLEKLSDSLKKIADSFGGEKAAEKFKPESRESLLAKFQTPVLGGSRQGTDVGTSIKDLGEVLTRNHKESFELFKSIDTTLKKIQESGGSLGGGLDINIGGKGKEAAKGAAKAGASTAGRFLTRAVPIAAAGMAAFDAYSGYQEAAENLGVEGRETTLGEKLSSAAGSAVSGLTFGLLDKKKASQGIAGFFGAGPDKKAPPPVSTAELEGIVAPSPEVDIQAPPPISVKAPSPEVKVQAAAYTTVTAPSVSSAPTTTSPSISSAPSQPSAPLPYIGPSVDSTEKVAKLEDAKTELKDIYKQYDEEKLKTMQSIDGKYPGGYNVNPGDPRYPKELKAVDVKYSKIITEKKKVIEELGKSSDVKGTAPTSLEGGMKTMEDQVKQIFQKPSVTPKEGFMTPPSDSISSVMQSMSGMMQSPEMQQMQKQMSDFATAAAPQMEGMANEMSSTIAPQMEGMVRGMTEGVTQATGGGNILSMIKGVMPKIPSLAPAAGSILPSTTLSTLSAENADMRTEGAGAVQPVVINNTNSMSTNTSSIAPVRTLPRPSNNSFERKQSSVAMF